MFKHTLSVLAATLLLSSAAIASPLQSGAPPDRPPIARHIGETQDDGAEMSFNIEVPLTEMVMDAKVYCPKEPKALWCVGDGAVDKKLTMAQVQKIDVMLRAVYKEEVDQDVEKTGAYWRESTTGDCKTYALTLAQRLHEAGESGRNMALMASIPDPFEAHMTLIVDTSDAGMVEIGDEDGGEPHQFDIDQWVRLAFSPMDGQQLWYVMVPQLEVAMKFNANHTTHLVTNDLPIPKPVVAAKPLKIAPAPNVHPK